MTHTVEHPATAEIGEIRASDAKAPLAAAASGALAASERRSSRMLMAYIGAGLAFMLLPGTFLGVWNLFAISREHALGTVPAAWLQAHGHAQIFGWIGTFILGIGFYSLPRAQVSGGSLLARGWFCWLLWVAGVSLRWWSNVSLWHWRVLLPLSAALELLALAIFIHASFQQHARRGGGPQERQRGAFRAAWVWMVLAATVGELLTLTVNLIGAVQTSLHSADPAFSHLFDQKFLLLAVWGFLVPMIWGFSAKWLPIFLGTEQPHSRLLLAALAFDFGGIIAAFGEWTGAATLLLLAAAIFSLLAFGIVERALRPAKTLGVHSSFPFFLRLAYGWLLVSALLGVWAAGADSSGGIWGASRHAVTVGFVAAMVLTVAPRILPAFSGMKLLFSPRLMFFSLALLHAGCALRVTSEVLAYQRISAAAWHWLPVSAVAEISGILLFAVNMVATFLSTPPHLAKRNQYIQIGA